MDKTKKNRPSPSASATGFAPGTRMTGNDGGEWVVAEASNGVRRWKRALEASIATGGGRCVVSAVFPVVLDDLLGVRSRLAGKGLSHPSGVPPPDARALLRRRIKKNDFGFEHLAETVPLVAGPSRRRSWWWWQEQERSAVARLAHYELIERANGWAVELRWAVDRGAAEVDLAAFKAELAGQLSDGWGEGVEQFRFGPLVVCELDDYRQCRPAKRSELHGLQPDLDGRYAFNLTTVRGRGGVLFSMRAQDATRG